MHVRFIPAMALLAGALALVGCGGGNGVAPSSKEEMKTGTETETETEPKALTETLPTGGSVGYSTVPRKISVASDGTPKKVGNVYFTCSGDEACVINIPAGADPLQVSYTGGTLAASLADPDAPKPPTVAAQPDSDSWLSDKNLVAGVIAGDDGGITLQTDTGLKVTADKAGEITIAGNKLTLDHNRPLKSADADKYTDYLVWGIWEQPPAAGSGTAGKTMRKQLWAGSQPYAVAPPTVGTAKYGGDPSNSADDATGANTHGKFKLGSGSWKEWGGKTELTADFGKGTVGGHIIVHTTALSGAESDNDKPGKGADRIVLKPTQIGSTFSGSATIRTIGSGANAPSSGTWEGGLYGPSDGTPTGIAGGFNANRPAVAAAKTYVPGVNNKVAVEALSINGAFGATE